MVDTAADSVDSAGNHDEVGILGTEDDHRTGSCLDVARNPAGGSLGVMGNRLNHVISSISNTTTLTLILRMLRVSMRGWVRSVLVWMRWWRCGWWRLQTNSR